MPSTQRPRSLQKTSRKAKKEPVVSPFRDAFLKRPQQFQQLALDANVTSDIPPRRS